MDETVNRYARELIEAVSAAIARDGEVQECRARARAAGYEIKMTLEAAVGVVDKSEAPTRARAAVVPPSRRSMPAPQGCEITAADRRFLRSLRIAADEARESVE